MGCSNDRNGCYVMFICIHWLCRGGNQSAKLRESLCLEVANRCILILSIKSCSE